MSIHYRGSDVIDPEQRLIGTIDDVVYDDDGEPIEEKLERLKGELFAQFAESERLSGVVREQLGRVS